MSGWPRSSPARSRRSSGWSFVEREHEEQLHLKESTGATVGCSFGNIVGELGTVTRFCATA